TEKERLKREMDKLLELYMVGEIPKEGFGLKYQPLFDRHKELEEERPELQGEIDFLKIRAFSSDQIISDAKDLYSRWPSLSQEEKRKIVEAITESIIVEKDTISINLSYLPSPSEFMVKRQHEFKDSLPPPAESARENRPAGWPWKW
ncbi:MAG: hypothetical protein ACXWTN_07735, partial [Methylosarcina sp.]